MSRESLRTKEIDELQRRIALLEKIVAESEGRLDHAVVLRANELHGTASARLGHGTSFTVVALAGATGSGKSSLFNAISQTDFATAGIRRPTTSQALALVFGDGAEDLLNWLDIKQRRRMVGEAAGELEGLILVDLPDHDSTEMANRAEVDRLVQVVDVFMWVVDPQKYADAELHDKYLRAFAGHGAVSLVVLNQIDRLRTDERRACIDDLGRLLVADGLQGVRVIPASATTGEGIEGLRRELSARVAERQALIRRIDADLDWLATDLAVAVGEGSPTKVTVRSRDSLVEAATEAAGARVIEHAVDASYRRRAALAVGWPPLRWVRRTKSDPLARLGLGTKESEKNRESLDAFGHETGKAVSVRRTAIATDPVAHGRLGESLRQLGREVTSDLPETPRASIGTHIDQAMGELPDALDAAAATADLSVDRPRWWSLVGSVQMIASVAMLIGLVWLLALFVLGWLRLPDPPLPRVGDVPLPTLLALGGAAVGLLLATIGRQLAAIGAQRRARAARASLAIHAGRVVDDLVIEPVNVELAALGELATKIHQLAR